MDHLHARPKEFHTYYVTSGSGRRGRRCTSFIRVRLGVVWQSATMLAVLSVNLFFF